MIASTSMLAFLQNLGMPELIVIGIVALLLFGRRLPEVGRSLGKGIVEFKKGLKNVSDDVEQASNQPSRSPQQLADRSSTEAMRQMDQQHTDTKVS